MKALLRLFSYLILASALLAVLGYLHLKTQELNPATRETINGLLRDLQQIDAEIDTDVLRSKTGMSKNYDSVARAQTLIAKAQEALASQRLESFDYSLKDAEKRLTDALSTKLELVDRFKAQNAILRNSLRFVPLAAEDLKQKLREARDPAGKPVQVPGLADGVDQVLVETLKLEAAADTGAVAKVRERISPLVARRAEYPPAIGESFDIFANHVITIVAQKEREDEVLADMAKVPVVDNINSLGETFAASFELANAVHEKYRMAMLGYAAFLIALFSFAFGRRVSQSAAAA